ncbi:MAG: cryptochrome/photolyase family protein, partial [Myxococcota bacterium]
MAKHNPSPAKRSWLFVPYDQLSDQIGPLAREDPATLGIIVVESPWKAARRPYHKAKLALVLA